MCDTEPMIWIAVIMYVWAGATIGRVCYEYDVFAPPHPARSGSEAYEFRRHEIRMSWLVGVFWWGVALAALYVHAKNPRT